MNRAGERLLGQTAGELYLEVRLDGPAVTTLQMVFPGGPGRWGVRRTRIREHGLPLELVVIADLTQALSEQELHAWQRLVRVLGHDLNNSGSGIGLVLSRQIAEGHGGGLSLENRADGPGCVARLRLPV